MVATVNLDVGRPVIWNIGAIAASGHPQALDLFRRILLASASVPGAFPPVLLNVEMGGRRFQEMHVDGGAAVQVFLYPPGLSPRNVQE
jgi:predicted acylesterase/phospholipase RssA